MYEFWLLASSCTGNTDLMGSWESSCTRKSTGHNRKKFVWSITQQINLNCSSASSLWTCRYISPGLMDLCIFKFLKWSQIWSHIDGSFSFSQFLLLSFMAQVVLLEHLLVKTKATKSVSTSAFSISCLTRSPVSFWRGFTFSLVFLLSLMLLQKLFLLLLVPLARFNFIRALAFLTWSLTAWITSLYSSQLLFLWKLLFPVSLGFFLC